MDTVQPGILSEETALARYLSFRITDAPAARAAFEALIESLHSDESVVIGLGMPLLDLYENTVPGMREFPAASGNEITIPARSDALWFWLRGNDRGVLYHRSRELVSALSPAFALADVTDSFQYNRNRDLSGYEDGTENPRGNEAIEAATASHAGPGMDGSSYVAVLPSRHDMDRLDGMTVAERDDMIGRHIADNEEFDEAPESAHVKRTAQESFEPEAFILRRSMPWADGMDAGLVFVAFGKSFDAFEAILHRMLGNEDGITDALFGFTTPLYGAYYWCPPARNGKIDLRAVLG